MEKYEILGQLPGDPGVTYFKCRERKEHGKEVVIKEFACRNFQEAAVHIREAIVTAEIAHPHICKMIELIPSNTGEGIKIGIVLETISRSLLQEIEARRNENPQRRFTEPELRIFLGQVASALQFANEKVKYTQGIAHRDLNPEHIFINENGEYKLSDFGSAWRSNDQKAFAQTLVGQLTYMCPAMKAAKIAGQTRAEQPIQVDKIDTYSLAATMIYMHRLYPPNDLANNSKHDEHVAKYLNGMRGDGVSQDFVELVENMLKYTDADRFNATNVIETLSQSTPQTHIAAVQPDFLYQFNFSSDAWEKLSYVGVQALPVDEKTASVFFDETSLFCCGGGPQPCEFYADKASFVIKLGDHAATVRQVGNMTASRGLHGLVFHADSDTLFAFGGVSGGAVLNTCERIPVPRGNVSPSWIAVGRNMNHPRSSFNPCVHAGLIYLVGGGHPSIEKFNPRFNQFTIQVLNIDPAIGISVSHQDKLSMISPGRVYRRSTSTETFELTADHTPAPAWSNIVPVVSENAVFVVTIDRGHFVMVKLGAVTGRVLATRSGN